MPDVVLGAPEETEYTYVLVHHGMPKNQRILIGVYDESKTARLVPWPYGWKIPTGPNTHNGPKHEGDLATFAFVNSRHLFARMQKLGWTDVTTDWRAFVARQHGDATRGDLTRLGATMATGEVQELPQAPEPTDEQEAPPKPPEPEQPVQAAPAQAAEPEKAPEASEAGATTQEAPPKPAMRVVQTAEPLRRKPTGK